jgi:hypothetical protein
MRSVSPVARVTASCPAVAAGQDPTKPPSLPTKLPPSLLTN